MGKKKYTFFHVLMALLVSLALFNWGTVSFLNFNIVSFITFNISWLGKIIYAFVSIVGLIWVISIVSMLLMRKK
jgi:uncharacterized membrane protein YuzA (DUF378 family)